MTTTTTFQGMEPGAKNSSRILRPPGGGSNITLGADEEKPPARKNKMASSVFAEPEDPYANRRNNPPGGKPTGVLCGESSAPLRRGGNHTSNHTGEPAFTDGENSAHDSGLCSESSGGEADGAPEQQEEPPQAEEPAPGGPPGRRNPPGGKSSLILG